MSLELLSTLEAKIQTTLETMELLHLEAEEERQRSNEFEDEIHDLKEELEALKEENSQFQLERQAWNNKIVGLVDLLKDDNTNNSDEE